MRSVCPPMIVMMMMRGSNWCETAIIVNRCFGDAALISGGNDLLIYTLDWLPRRSGMELSVVSGVLSTQNIQNWESESFQFEMLNKSLKIAIGISYSFVVLRFSLLYSNLSTPVILKILTCC